MKIAVVVHRERPLADRVARRLLEVADLLDVDVVMGEGDAERFGLDAQRVEGLAVDAVVAIGGDGTVLQAATVALAVDAPILGVNAGRVGFLTDVEPDQLEEALRRLVDGRWSTNERMTIEATSEGASPALGINDVVVEKVVSQRLVSLDVSLDGERYLTYHADGLVIATTTGSTAYNLSAGGPLADPRLDALILTPVAPHGLFVPSMVLPPDAVIECRVAEDRPVGVNIDGRDLGTVDPGGTVRVRRGSRRVAFVALSGRSFPSNVRRKFRLPG